MAALVSDEVADEIAAGERQVADQIERLVPDALVLHSQLVVDRPFRTEDQQVLVGHPLAEAPLAQPLGFFSQQERAGGGELGLKYFRRDLQLDRLPADRIVRSVIKSIAYLKAIALHGAGF